MFEPPSAAETTIAADLRFPEGPVALRDGSVAFVEVEGQRLGIVRPDGTVETLAHLGGGPNGLAVGPDGAFYVCNNGGLEWARRGAWSLPVGPAPDYRGGSIQRVDPRDGSVTVLYDYCGDDRLSAPNDLVFDQYGGFYFTDTGKAFANHRAFGAIYYALADGSSITKVATHLHTPNGIALSGDQKTLFVSEMDSARLWSFAIEAAGVLAKLPFPSPSGGRFVHGASDFRRFDSMAVASGDVILQATLVEGGITIVGADGTPRGFRRVSDPYCTNLCFGAGGAAVLFVTLGLTGRIVRLDWDSDGLPLNFEI